jgi:sulfur transfer complex TusBCD TusB component (DsrH family)
LPEPPFIVYLVAYSSNMMADNKVHHEIKNVQIELYTDKKDLIAENKVASVLNENELPYQTTETFIEAESLFQKIYEVRLF